MQKTTSMWVLPIARELRAFAMSLALVGTLSACSALDVDDPTTIQGTALDNANGATGMWTWARVAFANAASRATVVGGLLADEFYRDAAPDDFGYEPMLDQRNSLLIESNLARDATDRSAYNSLQTLWRQATVAIPRVRAYALPGARGAQLGELFALRGFAMLGLAETICPGFPVRELDGLTPVFGPPLTTDQAFTRAIAEFDSAFVYATDSARVQNLARIGKARALLGLGRFAEAGTLAASVPAGYVASGVPTNVPFLFAFQIDPWGVSDKEGGTGLDFVSAGDPRITLVDKGHPHYGDTTVVRYVPGKYPGTYPTFILASDVEARLIEAEAALNAHRGTWLTILNDLRAHQITPPLPALVDPGTFDQQVDLLFRERAFWLFATGHRLGDLRRLISRYSRGAETVFPTGTYRTSGSYGIATSVPFDGTFEHAYNSAVTGCATR